MNEEEARDLFEAAKAVHACSVLGCQARVTMMRAQVFPWNAPREVRALRDARVLKKGEFLEYKASPGAGD